MKMASTSITDVGQLRDFLLSEEIVTNWRDARSTLVLIYTAHMDPQWLGSVATAIREIDSSAHIVGATTTGEVFNGESVTGKTVVTVLTFKSTGVLSYVSPGLNAGGDEIGADLRDRIQAVDAPVAAIMLLTTPLTIDSNEVVRAINNPPLSVPVFGGGAGDYAMKSNFVVCGTQVYSAAAIAVVFTGSDLVVEKAAYLGWRSMSNEMVVTGASGMVIETIDGVPALDIYRRYLDIQDDKNFFSHTLGFPFLVHRGNHFLARVSHAVGPNGSLIFISDVNHGEKLSIGFMDPSLREKNSAAAQRKMAEFMPEGILLFTCGCRRWVLRDDVLAETKPYQSIAPTTGFYTIGEFCDMDGQLPMLNLTFVAVGMREGPIPSHEAPTPASDGAPPADGDVYVSNHSQLLSRLLHFIDALNADLSRAHEELKIQSITDKLTGVFNRTKLDETLNNEIEMMRRYGAEFSVIILDADHFKSVNDTHGHNVGDAVLVKIAGIISSNARVTDIVGRWGGEEFLVILPNTGLEGSVQMAEKLRSAIASASFPVVGNKTASLGVASSAPGDTVVTLIGRADECLYRAKRNGRNQVVAGI